MFTYLESATCPLAANHGVSHPPPRGNLSILPMKNPQDAGWTCSQSLWLSYSYRCEPGVHASLDWRAGLETDTRGDQNKERLAAATAKGWAPYHGRRESDLGDRLGEAEEVVSPGRLSLSERCPEIK